MANLYLDESLPEAAFAVGGEIRIDGAEARHAVTVSRLRVGERVLLGDGSGWLAEAIVRATESKAFLATVEAARFAPEAGPRLVLAQALAKGDRDERAIETATEHGVDEILPWQAERSVSRWSAEKAVKGRERWRAIVREAAKQSLRPRVPTVSEPVSSAALAERAAAGPVLVLHPNAELRLSEVAAGLLAGGDAPASVTLVVGPEGGVSPGELAALVAAGAIPVLLGETVLRTSSAGPAGLAVLNVALGRW